MQTASLIFTDEPDGKVNVCLAFNPALPGGSHVTPAIALALKALRFVAKQGRASAVEEE